MKFVHCMNFNGFGGTTIVYYTDANALTFAVAQCSIKDRYNRGIGRKVALDHYLAGNKITIAIKGTRHQIERKAYAILESIGYNINHSHIKLKKEITYV